MFFIALSRRKEKDDNEDIDINKIIIKKFPGDDD